MFYYAILHAAVVLSSTAVSSTNHMTYRTCLALLCFAASFYATFPLAEPLRAWNRTARWDRLSGCKPPRPGSFGAWLERRRPAWQAVGAWIVTTFFLLSLRKFLLVAFVVILLLSGWLPETLSMYLRELLIAGR